MTHQPTVRKIGEGRTIGVVGDVYRFLATGNETNGKYAVWEAIVPPGGGPPPHVHSREEEGFFVLEGEISIAVDGEHFTGLPGTFVNLPVGSLHSFRNTTDKPAKMLISIAPAGLEKMFFEVGQPLPAGATTSPPHTPADLANMLAVAARYGVEIRAPKS
jgi:quercetin dioxygenase-like cupin family protein